MVSQDLLDAIVKMSEAVAKLRTQMRGLQNLIPCSICAAIIPSSAEQKHIDWHKQLQDQVDLLEDLTGRTHG